MKLRISLLPLVPNVTDDDALSLNRNADKNNLFYNFKKQILYIYIYRNAL